MNENVIPFPCELLTDPAVWSNKHPSPSRNVPLRLSQRVRYPWKQWIGRLAMIVSPNARKQSSLIAQHAEGPHFAARFGGYGLAEDNNNTNALRGNSAACRNRQTYRDRQAGYDFERLIDFLRQRYQRLTAQNVAADCGLSVGTVENWLLRKSTPSAQHFAALIQEYGPDFLDAVLPQEHRWVREAVLRQQEARIQQQIEMLALERERLSSLDE